MQVLEAQRQNIKAMNELDITADGPIESVEQDKLNRRAFSERLAGAIARRQKRDSFVQVAALDLRALDPLVAACAQSFLRAVEGWRESRSASSSTEAGAAALEEAPDASSST